MAYLNDDRALAAWHFDSIEEVKRDPSKYLFDGTCRTEDSSITVATSFPIQNGQNGSVVMLRENAPVRAEFDRRTRSVVFELPYLYEVSKNGSDTLYSLLPPRISSTPESNVAEEMRCKALSDSELTYRFLICRARLVDRSPRNARRVISRPLGGAAFYILSDGNEARSTVKLSFEDSVEPASPHVITWEQPALGTPLTQLLSNELRIQFGPTLVNPLSQSSQIIRNGATLDVASSARPNGDYCMWYRVAAVPEAGRQVSSTLVLRTESASAISAGFEMQAGGHPLGTLLCYFSPAETAESATVGRWQSIVGKLLSLQMGSKP